MSEGPRARLVAYGVAVLATAVTVLVRWLLWPVLEDAVPHMFFFPAIMIAAYYGGFGPGFLSTLLGALAANFFFTEPHYSLQIKSLNAAVALPLFMLVGAIISGLSESLHRARRRIVADERRRAEEALRETEERFRQLAENIHEVFWERDARDDRLLYISPCYEELSGRTCQAVYEQPRSWVEGIHPDDRDRAAAHMEQYRRGVFTDGEFRIVRPDGSVRWVRNRAFPIKDQNGHILRIAGLAEDITERRQMEEELRQANARVELAVRGSNVAIWEIDMPDGVYRNGRGHTLNLWEQLGYDPPADSVDYATWMALFHPEDRERTERAIQACLGGETKEYEAVYRVRHSDGSYRWVLSRGIAVRDAAGKPIRFVGSRTDITDRKRAEQELRQAKEAAEAANRAKDEFLANVSHEIRTPMNAILGMTELTLDTPLTDDQRQCLKTVKTAADNLLSIINDLLDFSKIEAGKLELDPADFGLRAALGDTLRALAVRAYKKGLELVSHVQPDVPDALVGDVGRLRQVLMNLVGNAIKFTDQGEVVVRVRTENAEPDAPAREAPSLAGASGSTLLRFTVSDTGIGIPPDKQGRIFRAFEQEDTSTTRKYGGTGLGLSIAARLAALMGGTITVDSAPGRGSTFAFTARFGRQPHPAEPVAAQPPVLLHGLPVLVVDDNATNRHILEEWLRSWRMEPAAAGDGLAALSALWHAVNVGQPYALVLLDARMPDTDGLALAGTIRRYTQLSATPVILLTSGDRPGDLARSRDLRIDAHLLKPVQQEELLETIHRVLCRAAGDGPAPGAAPAQEPSLTPTAAPLRVLVAEDNPFNAQLLEQLLARRGHHVRLANNGRETLTATGEGAFDLLLLDLHMPELDGFSVIQAIRARERATGGHLPVIALTARSRNEDRERCLAAGMDDFLAKPVRAADLWAAIDRTMAALPPEVRSQKSEAESEAPSSLTSDHCPLTSGADLLDPRVLLAACGGDGAILGRICQAFQAGLPDQLAAVRDALRDRDAPRLREAAHKFCGTVAAFSTAAGAVASDLEDLAALGRLDEAPPLMGRLESMAQALLERVGGLSLETLRCQAEGAHDQDRTAEPEGVDSVPSSPTHQLH